MVEEIGPFLLGDADDLERAMVAPPLQYLRQESLNPPTMPGQRRMEENEPRLWLESRAGRCHTHLHNQKGEDLALG